jgi:hypothetical protein
LLIFWSNIANIGREDRPCCVDLFETFRVPGAVLRDEFVVDMPNEILDQPVTGVFMFVEYLEEKVFCSFFLHTERLAVREPHPLREGVRVMAVSADFNPPFSEDSLIFSICSS